MSFLDPAKPYAQMAVDLQKQHMIDATQNNSTAANAQDAYNKAMVDAYTATNQGNVSKNDIATKNPSTFARQSAMAGILKNTPTFNSKGGSAVSYAGPGDDAKQSMTELQKQAINNLLEAPTKTPVPNTNTTAPTIKKFTFDDYGPSENYKA